MASTATNHTPRSLRARLGLSQSQVADRAGVSLRTIGSLELGADVSLDSVRSIARALEVEAQVLIDAIDFERARRAAAAEES